MVEQVSGIWKGQKWDYKGMNGGEEAEWVAATLAKLACKQRVDCERSALLYVSWEALDINFGTWNHGLLEQRCKEKDSQPSQQLLLPSENPGEEGKTTQASFSVMEYVSVSLQGGLLLPLPLIWLESPHMVGRVRGCWNPVQLYQPAIHPGVRRTLFQVVQGRQIGWQLPCIYPSLSKNIGLS